MLLYPAAIIGQEFAFSGTVLDKSTSDTLYTAHLEDYDGGFLASNERGIFRLALPRGRHLIKIRCEGYVADSLWINITKETQKTFRLQSYSTTLSAVEVSADEGRNISRIEPSVSRLTAEAVRAVPAMMGEVDLVKALQLLPGVQAISEGSSNFSVRGGGFDQNLILLDETPLYSSSHLLGFLSIFNNDIVRDVKLYKGDMPAHGGGRLSSLMEVTTKEGNSRQLRGRGGIGTIASRLMLEGPILPDKLTFFVSARRTYADLFLKLSRNPNLRQTKLYFYDLNAKLSWQVGQRDRLSLSAYTGKDHFANHMAGIAFGNTIGTLRWQHIFSDKVIMNLTTFVNYYNYFAEEDIMEEFRFDWKSEVRDFGTKLNFALLLSEKHTINTGYQLTYRELSPGKGSGSDSQSILNSSEFKTDPLYHLEHALYASHQTVLWDKLNIRYGLRLSMINNLGNDSVIYNLKDYKRESSFTSKRGKVYHTSLSLEPRLSLNYTFTPNNSLKFSYTRSAQYLQLASNSMAGSPLDIWFSASQNVRPQIANQLVLGYFHNFLGGMLESSAEVYYKHFQNVIDFRDRANLINNNRLEEELRFGNGYSYGFELMLSKPKGNLNGWVSYTFSRSFRKIDHVNSGEWYRSPYDKPHNISLVVNYLLGKRWSFSASWIYSTGQPVTFPEGRYWVGNLDGTDGGRWVPIPSKRNAYRFPDYHRLDLSATWKLSNPKRRFQHELNLSLYNAYARKNPWTIYFTQNESDPTKTEARMIYLFSIVPSLSWNFSF